MSLDITQERKDKACSGISSLLKDRNPSLRDRLKVLGFLASMHSIMSRDLTKKKIVHLEEREELKDWLCFLRRSKTPLHIWCKPFRDFFIISTDASESGVGAVFHTSTGRNRVSSSTLPCHLLAASSTARELFGFLYALKAFSAFIYSEKVQIQTDSQTAQAIWETTERLSIHLEVFWIPRELNQEADKASRVVDLDSWSILDSIYEKLYEIWGPFEADLFASAENKKYGSAKVAQPSTRLAIPQRNSGPGVLAGPKWKAWSETIQSARNAGREELAQIIGTSANKSLAPGTIAAYSSMRRRFDEFTTTLAIEKTHLGKLRNLFLAHLINQNQLKILSTAVASLNFFYGHLEDGEAELQKLLMDSAKKEAPAVMHKEKASEEDVDKMVEWALNMNTAKATEDCCIILLSYLAFLRISETAAVRKEHLQAKGGDIWWLLIPKSKTDQSKRGTEVAFKVQGRRAVLWNKFVALIADKSPHQFIFSPKFAHQPSTDSLRKRIDNVLQGAGLLHKGFTSHSFRGGAAAAALRRGVSYEDIRRVG
ncbi:site-specific recombinase, phage integrase family, partial [Cooperia oncophora]